MKRILCVTLMFVMLALSCTFVGLYVHDSADNSVDDADEYIIEDGSIVQVSDELNPQMLDYAIRLFNIVNSECLRNNNVYFALIPDKHLVSSDDVSSYEDFYDYMKSGLSFATPVDIYDLVCMSDYYRTDPHIKQECLVDVADRLCTSMGAKATTVYETHSADIPFVGVSAHKSGLEVEPDTLVYITSGIIDNLQISDGIALYNHDKLETDEPYDFFLSGNHPVVTIRNELADTDKRLVLFRDSFSSSIAPLLCEGYKEVVLVDLRYVMSEYLLDYVEFDNADVLFLYSTLMVNNSMSMK